MNAIAYNEFGQATSIAVGAGGANPMTETYTFDANTGLMTNQTVQRGATSLMNLSYSYARGNSKGTLNGTTGNLTNVVNNLDRNKDRVYEYDTLGRLIKAKGGIAAGGAGVANWTQDYGYDRYGNKLTTASSGVTANSAAIPLDGMPLQVTNAPSNRIVNTGYYYDQTGNLTRARGPDQSWQRYEYDTAGRLVKIKTDAGVVLEEYTYGASRERLRKEANNQRTYYAWGGSSVLMEYFETTAALTWAKSYIYAGSRLLSTITNTAGSEVTEYHHPDRLGTRLISNPVGATQVEQNTLPFGTSIDAETSGTSNQRFTSYDRSYESGLDYAVNRTYNSGQSRFTQVDPIGIEATDFTEPQSLNLFAYVQNNPIDFTDPDGLLMAAPFGVTYYLDGFEVSARLALSGLMGGWAIPDRHFENPGWLGRWEDFDDYSTADEYGFPGTGTIFVINQSELQRRLDEIELGQTLDRMQSALDIIGFIPGPGDAIDVVNACISFGRGNNEDAILSAIAVIPLGGSIAKGGLKSAKKFNKLKALPGLKFSGVMGGVLPKVQDLRKYPKSQLLDFQADLIKSVQKRIENFVQKGPTATKAANKGHGKRLADEQRLIKSIGKICDK